MDHLPPTHTVPVDDRTISYCLYGPEDGVPVIAHGGSPGTRWRRPDGIAAMERAGIRVVVFDRPGYPGSTRRPGRRIADCVADVRALADAQGWERFALHGYSGGVPYALASAAALGDRVTRCAIGAGVAPPDADGVDFFGRRDPTVGRSFRMALAGEDELRPHLAAFGAQVMAAVDAGGPEMIPSPGTPLGPPARDDPAAMARLRATFVDGLDGWIDDQIAVVHPWGFDVRDVRVPVGIWHGRQDTAIPAAHTDWLAAHVSGAVRHEHDGGHIPDAAVLDAMHAFLTDTDQP